MNLSVLFNIPNIVGYIRIFLLIFGNYKSKTIFILCYSLSSALDFFDGFLARKYNQSSILGKCLDMFTDRVSTVVISLRCIRDKFPLYNFISAYVIIDLLSHMFHFYLSAIENTQHKECTNLILSIYYYKPFLFSICFLTELFFIYCVSNIKRGYLFNVLYCSAICKMGFHIVQLASALSRLSDHKEKLD
ncbi:CDP-diacylglycerol-inositol 3-phosphatidyltransferase [Vairimorpha necatrix]|uniref:CDP-diacylglycerol-inositol 3-phosphatidyltransferase n=1 Tax=Vairimorpha necatrix TaxID=6039 RepID=A0AAX4JFM6_9MICR